MAIARSAHRSLSVGRPRPALRLPLVISLALAVLAVGFVAFVLWPRWPGTDALNAPAVPITVAGELFNVPPAAIRLAAQRHAGPQERLDLAFLWPSLTPPDPAAKPSLSDEPNALDRLFLTVAAADGTLPPAERINAIFRRYLAQERFESPDGLTIMSFRDGTPYQGEDLYLDAAAPERFMARCTRPGAGGTPGMCLYEQRIGAASVTARFPREWLADWRGLVRAVDRLIASLRPAGR
ncbi:MAG TPA: hypothetical protein VK456_10895 [Xanthobacteraceae bacterium]|nr:hypothetical protein [Xanthobacteraceae bacterium]